MWTFCNLRKFNCLKQWVLVCLEWSKAEWIWVSDNFYIWDSEWKIFLLGKRDRNHVCFQLQGYQWFTFICKRLPLPKTHCMMGKCHLSRAHLPLWFFPFQLFHAFGTFGCSTGTSQLVMGQGNDCLMCR